MKFASLTVILIVLTFKSSYMQVNIAISIVTFIDDYEYKQSVSFKIS